MQIEFSTFGKSNRSSSSASSKRTPVRFGNQWFDQLSQTPLDRKLGNLWILSIHACPCSLRADICSDDWRMRLQDCARIQMHTPQMNAQHIPSSRGFQRKRNKSTLIFLDCLRRIHVDVTSMPLPFRIAFIGGRHNTPCQRKAKGKLGNPEVQLGKMGPTFDIESHLASRPRARTNTAKRFPGWTFPTSDSLSLQ